jgi:predicted dithiol-disulfide oxidoreductase (DUF899 family)
VPAPFFAAFVRLRDELSRQRRQLPWVKVEKRYVFEAPQGQQTLADLFDGMNGYPSEELHGASVFYKDADGQVYHTYSAYARGCDILLGAYNYLDLAPKGRDEEGLPFTVSWVRHHDRYGDDAS